MTEITYPVASGIHAFNFADADSFDWSDYHFEVDGAPEGTAPGQSAVLFESEDGRVRFGAWRRDADGGINAGSAQCFDFIVEGSVTLRSKNGREVTANAGDLLIYNAADGDEWIQSGPIKKFYLQVANPEGYTPVAATDAYPLEGGPQAVNFDDPKIDWQEYPFELPGDSTPEGTGPGEYARIHVAEQHGAKVGSWTREIDYGDIAGSGQCFDIVVDGSVTLVDASGRRVTANSGGILIYNENDEGEWIQDGPIKKFYVHV